MVDVLQQELLCNGKTECAELMRQMPEDTEKLAITG